MLFKSPVSFLKKKYHQFINYRLESKATSSGAHECRRKKPRLDVTLEEGEICTEDEEDIR